MSRLDSFIRRLEAQRDCLGRAAALIRNVPGLIFELGLGNGRTYDHLRESLPGRDIFVFDRRIAAHPDCVPPNDRLFLGDLRATLPEAVQRFSGEGALAHLDFATGDSASSLALAAELAPLVVMLVKPGGVIVSEPALAVPGLAAEELPAGVPAGRYHLYRVQAAPPRTQNRAQ